MSDHLTIVCAADEELAAWFTAVPACVKCGAQTDIHPLCPTCHEEEARLLVERLQESWASHDRMSNEPFEIMSEHRYQKTPKPLLINWLKEGF